MEEWKDIIGYEGLYKVSNLGNVKSVERILSNGHKHKEKHLYTHLINGYVVVSLFKDGKQRNFKVYRLVAKSFIPNPENKPCVDHIDTNKENNKVENLKWVTYQENTDNPLSSIRQKQAVSIAGTIKVSQYDKNWILLNIYPSAACAERMTGTNASSICSCCKGRRKTANGFIWKYVKK